MSTILSPQIFRSNNLWLQKSSARDPSMVICVWIMSYLLKSMTIRVIVLTFSMWSCHLFSAWRFIIPAFGSGSSTVESPCSWAEGIFRKSGTPFQIPKALVPEFAMPAGLEQWCWRLSWSSALIFFLVFWAGGTREKALSTDWFLCYTNCMGSRESGMMLCMCFMISLSDMTHLILSAVW